jgi:hypothetical protein
VRRVTYARCAIALVVAAVAAHSPGAATAKAPELLRTPGYQSSVRSGPGDLLLIAGSGFRPTDRVVYQAIDTPDASGEHPSTVPTFNTASLGTASIVKRAAPAYAITIRLPELIEATRAYRIWIADDTGEWSAPISINDPRPQWITPAYVYSRADFAALGRRLRVVGRNLDPRGTAASWIQLQGPNTYVLATSKRASDDARQQYVAEAPLPDSIAPGSYSVSVSRDRHLWTSVIGQQLEVRPDPPAPQIFDLDDPRFGGCKPDDDVDDTGCLALALEAARRAGGGIVHVPKGKWDVCTVNLPAAQRRDGLIVAPNVRLHGDGASASIVTRHRAIELPAPGALLTLVSANEVSGLSFTDAERYESIEQTRAVIQLGPPPGSMSPGILPASLDDVVISGNSFIHVGRALVDGGLPIRRLFVTHNEFGAYDNALYLTGSNVNFEHRYRIDDAVFRWNRFVPGSFLDISIHQGTIATQLGASERVDFSDNVADGASLAGLQDRADRPGWRAAFFWALNNNVEELLISGNRISCSGDKAGDGEAFSLDANGNTFGFDAAQPVDAAGPDWVRIHRSLVHQQYGRPVPPGYYDTHWLWIVAGPGMGQARRIRSYTEDPATGMVTLRISPGWDVVPAANGARVIVGMQFWHVYIVGNDVNQASPPCHKTNLNGPRGGVIFMGGPVADSTIENNRQVDTDGIEFFQGYNAHAPSCPNCVGDAYLVSAFEIRGNVIEGEYDWSSDCSWSGIRSYFVASPTPEEPPPLLGFGTVIAHNTISHADGQRGGAIEIAHAGTAGPPPGRWAMVKDTLIYGNVIRDISGEQPRSGCRDGAGQLGRTGIRLEGPENVRDTVLEGNICERVDTPLEDSGVATARICTGTEANSCECGTH